MHTTTLSLSLQQALNVVLDSYPLVMTIVQRIDKQGGRALLVGGAVRDLLLGLDVKDLDIEVHGLSLEQLEAILRKSGPVSLVGKSFGVLRLHILDVDWSLPRTDSSGRKPVVELDPAMSMHNAFRRRDVTINAMGIDLITFELIDPFNGVDDLLARRLRAPDANLFIEDPLRFYRVMQFIGRFEMKPDNQLQELCKTMDISTISRERIEAEFEKLLLKSQRPSLGIRWLHDIGRLYQVLPELAATVGVAQEYAWHPEGDVFEHTMQALDAAVPLPGYQGTHKLVLMYAVLCHDIGKTYTTSIIDGKIKSPGHAEVGAKLSKKLMRRITHNVDLLEAVFKLVKYHMAPGLFVKEGAKLSAYKRMACKLAPDATMQMLGDLAYADKRGRNPDGTQRPLTDPLPDIDEFLRLAELAHVRQESEKPVLLGRDLLDVIKPGPQMGRLLQKAYEIQIEEGICDKEILKARVLGE